MQVRHYSKGKFYLIEFPVGTVVARCLAPFVADGADSHDFVVGPFRGQAIAIPADLPKQLPLLAESGRCGLSLAGEPVRNVNLAGGACPNCNEDDVCWLLLEEGLNVAHCDYCGCEFELDGQI